MAKTWFIAGGTPGGFGMAFADAALEVGDRVVLTARRPDELRSWSEKYSDRVLVLPLDVTDAVQVRDAIDAAEKHFGGIDVLVNNAGRGCYGSTEFGHYSATKFAVEAVTEVLREEVAAQAIRGVAPAR